MTQLYPAKQWKQKRSERRIFSVLILVGMLVGLTGCGGNTSDISFQTHPVPKESGFKMSGWFVWGGSPIRVGDTYHLFASRWPDSTGFPQGYRTHSEIVRATAGDPLGPYTFQEVVIGERAPGYWDSGMAHNPHIQKIGDRFVLFYIGSDVGSGYRQIGYATADVITGPWTRSDQPIDFGSDANNPAVYAESDGSVKMMWRDKELRVYLAEAPSYSGPYTIRNDNVWPAHRLEDFYLWKQDSLYHMLCEDNRGGVSGHERWGVHFLSEDGVHDWHPADPVVFYDHTLRFTDGTALHCERRERPQLLFDDNGRITHLFTSALHEGDTWCQVVPVTRGQNME